MLDLAKYTVSPFVIGEFIAVRDELHGPFYVAIVTAVTAKSLRVHYYGTYHVVLATAVFKPCWNEVNGSDIVLQTHCPMPAGYGSRDFEPYAGEMDLKDVNAVLVARHLEFTKTGKLRFRALRSLAPGHDQLFRFTL